VVSREEWTRLLALLIATALAAVLIGACGDSGSDIGSDQFRDQTDNAILDFGEEGSESALEEAAEVVRGFFSTRAERDWAGICARLSRPVLSKLERVAISSTGLEDKSCTSFLKAFLRVSAREGRESTIIDAGSLREQAQRAFLIYFGAGKVVYAMPLSREGDGWKIASIAPERLN
jgi:hypothetical protein